MKNRSKKIIRIILLLIAAIFVVGIIIIAAWVQPIFSKVKQVQSLVDGVGSFDAQDIQVEDISRTIDLTEHIYFTIEEIKEDIEPLLPLIEKLDGLPYIGQYAQIVEPGLDYTSNLTQGAALLGRTFLPVVDELGDESSNNTPQILSSFFQENQEKFSITEDLFENAVAASKKIDPQVIPENYRDDFETINRYLTEAPFGFKLLRITPYLFASEEPVTYLVLAQNRDELRASGGFITAFGLVKLKEGRILALRFEDSTSYHRYNYVSELRDAPYPLGEIMFAHYLVARDANWSPDFPTAAQDTQEAHSLSVDIDTDAVIAFDQELLVKLLAFSGPIDLADDNLTITAENVEDKIIEFKQVAVDEDNQADRKDFLSIIAPHIINSILHVNEPNEMVELGKLLLELLEEGHLLVYFEEPTVQEVLTQMELDGAIHPGDGDYLMLVDSNVGFSKVDQFINRSLEYSVNLEDISIPQAEILLSYEHTQPGTRSCFQGGSEGGFPDYYLSRCYWNYWRVLSAKGTMLERGFHTPVPEEYFHENAEWHNEIEVGSGEADTTMISGLTVVPQIKTEKILLETSLPNSVIIENSDGGIIYNLRIQKQPGIISLPVKIQVTAPYGYTTKNLQDDWKVLPGEMKYEWDGDIAKTTDFQLEFVKL